MTDQTLTTLLRDFRRNAFRLEALDRYTIDEEAPSFAAFLRGEPQPPEDPEFTAWLEDLRAQRAAGKTVTRVHAIAGPLTPYLHFEIGWGYIYTGAAGEDIRILHRETWDEPFGAQPPDFWLFDDETVAVMHYDGEGRWQGATVRDDPASVDTYRQLRDVALRHAVPLSDYLAALRTTPVVPRAIVPVRREMAS